MSIEMHVTSLETSKKLRELGVNRKTYFAWELNPQNGVYMLAVHFWCDLLHGKSQQRIFAFMATELLPIEPINIGTCDGKFSWHCEKTYRMFEDKNFAELLGKKMIHEIENKLVTVEEINKRIGEK